MKKVLLNFYSKNNLGDDLFIYIITKRYKNIFTIITTQRTPLFKGIKNLNVHHIPYAIFLLSKALERLLRKRNILLQIYLRKNDLMAYIGGSIFIEGNRMARWREDRELYSKLSKPFYILGSNVGPYKSPEFLDILTDIYTHAKDVCFRDSASYKLFEDLSTTRVSSDIVFTLNSEAYKTKVKKQVVFSLIDGYSKFDDETAYNYELKILDLTRKFADKGYGIVYMSFCKHEGDENVIKQLIAKAPADLQDAIETHYYNGDMYNSLRKIMQSEVVIAARFHAIILGLQFGKKVLPMAYSDKTLDMLNDIKFKGPVVDIRKINEFDGITFDTKSLKENDVSRQSKIAELQFSALDKVLVRKG